LRRRLGQAGDDPTRENHACQQQGEDEVGRGRGVLDQRAAAKCSQRQATDRRDAIDETGAPWRVGRVQVDQRGTECRERDAGGDALHGASDQQDRDTSGDDEQDEGRALKRNRAGQERPATNVIGKAAENEQRSDQAEDVDREDDSKRGVRETPLSLVDDIQRRRRARRRGEDDEDCRDRRKGIGERKPTGSAVL